MERDIVRCAVQLHVVAVNRPKNRPPNTRTTWQITEATAGKSGYGLVRKRATRTNKKKKKEKTSKYKNLMKANMGRRQKKRSAVIERIQIARGGLLHVTSFPQPEIETTSRRVQLIQWHALKTVFRIFYSRQPSRFFSRFLSLSVIKGGLNFPVERD